MLSSSSGESRASDFGRQFQAAGSVVASAAFGFSQEDDYSMALAQPIVGSEQTSVRADLREGRPSQVQGGTTHLT